MVFAAANPHPVSRFDGLSGRRESLSMTLDTSFFTSLHESREEFVATSKMAFILRSSYQFSPDFNLGLNLGFTQRLNRETETAFTNFKLTLSRKASLLLSRIFLSPSLSVSLPTNERIRRKYSYMGESALSFNFTTSVEPFGHLVSVQYSPGVSRFLHRYTRSFEDSPNMEYEVSQSLSFSTHVMESLRLNLSGSFATAWSYQNHIMETFSMSQSFVYKLSKGLSLGFGHTNQANPFEHDGQRSNIRVYDENTSTIFGSLSLLL